MADNQDQNSKQPIETATSEDIEKNKVNAILSYLGVLILIPLLSEEAKKSPFAKFHMNQGLTLSIISAVGGVFFYIPIIGWFAGFVVFVFWLMGIIGAAQGRMQKVPIVGDVKLIK